MGVNNSGIFIVLVHCCAVVGWYAIELRRYRCCARLASERRVTPVAETTGSDGA